jgi:hypothetical protein
MKGDKIIDPLECLLECWQEEYIAIKEQLICHGGDPGGMKYNLLSAEALRLHECMYELRGVMLDDQID